MLQMRPYYEDTHVLMEDHLRHLLQQIESWLASDTADITAAKCFMLVLIKLLRGYKEQAETLSVLRDLDCFKLSRFEGSDADIRFWTGFYSYDALKNLLGSLCRTEHEQHALLGFSKC